MPRDPDQDDEDSTSQSSSALSDLRTSRHRHVLQAAYQVSQVFDQRWVESSVEGSNARQEPEQTCDAPSG